MRKRLALFLSLCVSTLSAATLPAAAQSVLIRTYDRSDYKGSLALSVDGGTPCRFQLEGKDQYRECTLELPREAQTIQLQGDFSWKHYQRGKQKAKGTQRWQIVDLGPMVSTLRDSGKPFGRRLHDFRAAKEEFERKNKALVESSGFLDFGLGQPAPAAAVKAAEKRLGFALPAEYTSLLLEAGKMTLGDSATTGPEEMRNAYDFMIEVWETPREDLAASVSPGTATLLKGSAPLFTEVGDGLGALLYHPKAEACGGQPGYYWIHQDSMEPDLLKNRDGKCQSFTESMVWLVSWLGLAEYEDSGLDVVLVDRGASSWTLGLGHDDGFKFELRAPERE